MKSKIIIIAPILTVLLVCLLVFLGGNNYLVFAEPIEELGDLQILMYHNVLPESINESKFEVHASTLRKDCEYLKNNGYNVISVDTLKKHIVNKTPLPEKAVMLTFDDGYMYDYTIALPILDEYNYSAVFSVVGDFTRFGKSTNAPKHYTYFEWDDIKELSCHKNITIANHSFALHKHDARHGAKIKNGESEDAYRSVLTKDTQLMIDAFKDIGISSDIYVYPYGHYCEQSEKILKEMGYKITMTCREGVNKITSDEDCLYLLRRYNRNPLQGSLKSLLAK